MRAGLIGTGGMAAARVRAIRQINGLSLAWICSRDEDQARAFLRKLDNHRAARSECLCLSDWPKAVQRDDAEAVIITSPNTLHFAMAEAALLADKHVLIEYPPTTELAQHERLLDLSTSKGLIYHIGLTYRLSPQHQKLKAMLDAQAGGDSSLGKPIAYIMSKCSGKPISRWYDKDELSGGMFVASYYGIIDQALDLLGPVKEVQARYVSTRRGNGVIEKDCANLMLAFESGCTGMFTYVRGGSPPGIGFTRTVLCEKGYLIVAGGRIRKITSEDQQDIQPETHDDVAIDTAAFLHATRTPQVPDPTGLQALPALRIAAEASRHAGID